jgi:hypothetical protein
MSAGRGDFSSDKPLMRMRLPDLQPVEHDGELIALVSRDRVHIVSPRLLALPAGDPELSHAAYTALLCSLQLAAGHEIDAVAAAQWATQELGCRGRGSCRG